MSVVSRKRNLSETTHEIEPLSKKERVAETKCEAHVSSREYALQQDKNDPLRRFRSEFHIAKQTPHTSDCAESIYLCGNSLGLLPKKADKFVREEMNKWALAGVEGHFTGERPWVKIDEPCVELSSDLVGASASEIVIMNGLSVNLHLMMVAFYKPTTKRHKIFMEDHAFCSDQHVVRSQLSVHGYDSEKDLITISPRENETYLRTEDIINKIEEFGDEIALVMFSGVQYYSGQFFDLKAITEAGHRKGCTVGFDLAHAVGNVPLKLHDWNVDFACWCSYKYLNSGPGSISGCFVHSRFDSIDLTHFEGWWGQQSDARMHMSGIHRPKIGAQQFQMSNPPVLACICLEASLRVFKEAGGIETLRKKSIQLTGYLETLLTQFLEKEVKILTPRDKEQRGCQLSLMFAFPIEEVHKRLVEFGVICDLRKPNVMRIAPVPLYNSFEDVFSFVEVLKKSINLLQEQDKPTSNDPKE